MSGAHQVHVSVVVPLFNEEENVKPLYERLKNSLSRLPCRAEVIFVDDGSTDSTLRMLQEVVAEGDVARVIALPANLGQHRAILEGYSHSKGDIIVTLDGDLQNPPEEIPRLVARLIDGCDVVAGWRKRRRDSSLRLLVSLFLNLSASLVTGVRMRDYGCMLRAYRREVLRVVSKYGRHTPFIPTLVASMGVRTCEVYVRHNRRERGRSKYSLPGLALLYLNLLSDLFHLKLGFRPRRPTAHVDRIAFFGYGLVGHACLELLLEMGYNVNCVITHKDDPGEEMWFPSVEGLAREKRIPVLTPLDVGEVPVAQYIEEKKPDLILSVFYRQIIPRAILDIPRIAAVNLHPAMLPRYRGRASLNWAIINGEKSTGVTLHHMSEKPDAGDIICQREFEISPEDNIETIYGKTVKTSLQLLKEHIPIILANSAPRVPQDESLVSHFGRRRPEDGRIDWRREAKEIVNLVRGVTHPFPGAFSSVAGKKILIWEATSTDKGAPPGVITRCRNGAFGVGTGSGTLLVKRAQVEGEMECEGARVLKKLGLKQGDRFDD